MVEGAAQRLGGCRCCVDDYRGTYRSEYEGEISA